MSKAYHNAAFVGDEGEKTEKGRNVSEKSQYVLELTEKGKIIAEVDYDPYYHRKVEHPTTNSETMFHLLKGSLGTGILAMPNAFRNAGYIPGAVGTIIIGVICTYCIHLLVKAEYELCKRKKIPSMNYPGVAEAALSEGPGWCKACAPYITNVVNTFLLIYQLGTCCVYVVFVASNIKSIADFYMEDKPDVRIYMLIILLPLILINWVRNLKYLAPFSTIANAVTLISFAIILYYIFREPISLEGKDAFGELKTFPLFFGTVLFALEAIGVILPLENEMKTPRRFISPCGVLNSSMTIIVLLYVGMGLFGYLNYGHDVEGSITLNLPPGDIMAQCVKGTLAFAIFVTHGLACYVAIDITWNDYITKKLTITSHKMVWEYVCRTLLVLVTFLLAVAIPNLELFISLFGALCLSALGLAFPALIQICTFWYYVSGVKRVWLVVSNTIIVVVGVAGLVIGTYTSLSEIIEKFFG